jgi:hypothetical protein
MASDCNKMIQEVFKPIFKANGFKKNGATWHHVGEELVKVFNIQGSQWSRYFYFNIGLYLRELGNDEKPTEFKCHVRFRVERLLSEEKEITKLYELLDFEKEQPIEQRIHQLEEFISKLVIPWFSKLLTKADVIKYIESQPKGIMVTKELFQLMSERSA